MAFNRSNLLYVYFGPNFTNTTNLGNRLTGGIGSLTTVAMDVGVTFPTFCPNQTRLGAVGTVWARIGILDARTKAIKAANFISISIISQFNSKFVQADGLEFGSGLCVVECYDVQILSSVYPCFATGPTAT